MDIEVVDTPNQEPKWRLPQLNSMEYALGESYTKGRVDVTTAPQPKGKGKAPAKPVTNPNTTRASRSSSKAAPVSDSDTSDSDTEWSEDDEDFEEGVLRMEEHTKIYARSFTR